MLFGQLCSEKLAIEIRIVVNEALVRFVRRVSGDRALGQRRSVLRRAAQAEGRSRQDLRHASVRRYAHSQRIHQLSPHGDVSPRFGLLVRFSLSPQRIVLHI